MYSVENPAFKKSLNSLEQLQYGPRFTGVGAQILGPDDKYICQYSTESQNFWGSKFTNLIQNFFFRKDLKDVAFTVLHLDKCMEFSVLRPQSLVCLDVLVKNPLTIYFDLQLRYCVLLCSILFCYSWCFFSSRM